MFDPSMKKKKKKKAPVAEEAPTEEEAAPAEDASEAEPMFDGKKKKKKKKQPFEVPGNEEDAAPAEDETPGAGIFDKKKKKKKKNRDEAAPGEDDAPESSDVTVRQGDDEAFQSSMGGASAEGSSAGPKQDAPAWADSDRDYTYEEMLARVFSFLHRANPDISGRKAFRMRPPQVFREGTKKVVLVNFPEICQQMNRPPEHVLAFMLAELGTSGSLDAASRVTFKGRFQPKHIESIVRQYLKEYVLCKLCKSPDTMLSKDSNTRLYFMKCNTCNASRCVQPIKSGYQAQIGKRKKR
jgi:translation initiation factor 2 subunit 2